MTTTDPTTDQQVQFGSPDWRFEVSDAMFQAEGSSALVFRIEPSKAFAFGKGEYSQTRYTF